MLYISLWAKRIRPATPIASFRLPHFDPTSPTQLRPIITTIAATTRSYHKTNTIMADPKTSPPLTRAAVQAAHELIKPHVHRTPVIHSRTLDEFASRRRTASELKGTAWEGKKEGAKPTLRIWIKCENLQRIGAFKARGAFHAVGRLLEDEEWVKAGGREKGVATHSSGNHAQAIALAAREHGIPAHVVMPAISNPKKVEATKGYGAVVYESGSTAPEREEMLVKVVGETGARFVPPYNYPNVILGQGGFFSFFFQSLFFSLFFP